MMEGVYTEDISDEEIVKAVTEARRVTNRDGKIERRNKGLSFYNHSDRPPFEGVTQERSDALRSILANRYAGFTHEEACSMVGVNPSTISNFISAHPDAWDQCHAEIRESVAREHFINLGYIRTALSSYAPHAIRTLYAIMCDKRNSAAIRRQCANDILKMANVDNSARVSDLVEDMAGQISSSLVERLGAPKSATIIEAEEYEELGEEDA